MTTISAEASTTERTSFGSSLKTMSKNGMRDATSSATMMPTNIAMPPSRGVGVVCTSRVRIVAG